MNPESLPKSLLRDNPLTNSLLPSESHFSLFEQNPIEPKIISFTNNIPNSSKKIDFSFEKNLNTPIKKSELTDLISQQLSKEKLEFRDIMNLVSKGAEKNGYFSMKKLALHQLAETLEEDIDIIDYQKKNKKKQKIINRLKHVFKTVFQMMSFIVKIKKSIQKKDINLSQIDINLVYKSKLFLKPQEKSNNLTEITSKIRAPNKVTRYLILYSSSFVLVSWGVFVYGYNYPFSHLNPSVLDLLGKGVNIAFAGKMAVLFLVDCLLALMYRDILNFLRNTPFIGKFFNIFLNEHITIHKLCGYLLLLFSTIHTLGHLIGTFTSISDNLDIVKHVLPNKIDHVEGYTDLLFTTIPGITGIIMFFILLLILITSFDFIKKKHFQIFSYSHVLYIFFCILLYIHGSGCWFNGGLPYAVIYITPFFTISIMHHMKKWLQIYSYSPIVDVSFSAKNSVAYLKILKPNNFNIVPGQYLFLNAPDISYFQWHPFSIASVGANGIIKLMIKNNGDFTNLLLSALFKAKSDFIVENNLDIKNNKNFHNLYYDFLLNEEEIAKIVAKPKGNLIEIPKFIKLGLYGPISAPAVGSLNKKNVIFIGSGVGISPYLVFLDEYLQILKKTRIPKNIDKERQILMKITNNSKIGSEINYSKLGIKNHPHNKNIKSFFEDFEKIGFYYVARNLDQLTWISYYIHKLYKYGYDSEKLDIKLFLTTKPPKKIKNLEDFLFWRAYGKYQKSRNKSDVRMNFDVLSCLPLKIINDRPNFYKDFKEIWEGSKKTRV